MRVARDLVPELEIFVRTEYLAEVDELRLLGADVVVPAEFETALSLFERVLGIYDVPEEKIDKQKVNNISSNSSIGAGTMSSTISQNHIGFV